MNAFTLPGTLNRWHYINRKNIQTYCSTFPFLQKRKHYALCPYCKNPIAILTKASSSIESIYYGKHSTHSVPGFEEINRSKLNHCILKTQTPLFTDQIDAAFSVSPDQVNISSLRRALSLLIGVYVSNRGAESLLRTCSAALSFRNADMYNFPFPLLLEKKTFSIKGYKIANSFIRALINENSNYFYVEPGTLRTIEKSVIDGSIFVNMKSDKTNNAGIPRIKAILIESRHNEQHTIGYYFIECRMFDGLMN